MKVTILRKCWIYLFLFIVIINSTGCNNEISRESEDVIKEDMLLEEMPIELYVLEEVRSGKYEPNTGIYTGAYVQKDKKVSCDILKYEELIGQKQTFKVFNYLAEEGISKQDILKCIAQRKVPYIKLILGSDYDLTSLYQLIFDLKATYTTPLFVELYPLTEKDYSPELYKETYQRGYEILHKYFSNVVTVWGCDDSRIEDWPLYYPGDRYLDWAGMNIYIPRYKYNEQYHYNNYEKLDYWYKSFQNRKPMLISGLAISHFSKMDHAYTIGDTVEKLNLFYNETLSAYPRVKGIIYMDVNMSDISKSGKDDYTITGHERLIEAMKTLSIPLIINDRLHMSDNVQHCYQKYSVEAVRVEEKLYIPQEYMATCFSKIPLRKVGHIEDLSGALYYDYEDIKGLCTTFYTS